MEIVPKMIFVSVIIDLFLYLAISSMQPALKALNSLSKGLYAHAMCRE